MAKTRKVGGWNKGRAIGAMRPFTLEQVQLIRMALKSKGDIRGLALFETGIATVLRASDLLKLHVRDVLSDGSMVESFDVRMCKTGRNVHVWLTEAAKGALATYIATEKLDAPDRLWTIGRLRYSQIVKEWARMAHADPRFYSTHSIRRTTPTHIHKTTGSHEIPRQLLGHSSLARTVVYLGVEKEQVRIVKKLNEM
jgi:site-specific recombinase XerD